MGDIVVTHCNGAPDIYGYPQRIWAYDADDSIGWYGEEAMVGEWQLVKAAASRFQPINDTRVYLIRPTSPQHRSTQRLYADEFGSLTSDADWAAKEMFKAALRERYPGRALDGVEYVLTTGFGPPPPIGYDVVGDLRELKNFGERAPTHATASQR